VPLFDRVLGYAADGVIPGRTYDLLEWGQEFVEWAAEKDATIWQRVLLDPQTSGGLLIAVAEGKAGALSEALGSRGVLVARIGGFDSDRAGAITVR
jgi:selenide,water dikinase